MNDSLAAKLQGLHDLQLTDEHRELIRRYRCLMGISGFALWEWHKPTNRFHLYGQLPLEAGYSEEDINNISRPFETRGFYHPDDLERSLAIVEHHAQNNQPIHYSFRMLRKHGGYLWVTTMANAARDKHGRVAHIIGVVFDASILHNTQEALRTSELRLQRIVEVANDGIWEWHASSNRIEYSQRVLENLGFRTLEEISNVRQNAFDAWLARIHPHDSRRFLRALLKTLNLREPMDVAYRIADKNDSYRWVRSRGQGNFDDRGNAISISGTNIDITELKIAQLRLSKAKDLAESISTSKTAFLSGLNKELRTPMNAILGYAQLFERNVALTEKQQGNIREIRKAGEHLIQLIDDVMDLSKIESRNIELNIDAVEVAKIVRDCIGLCHPLAYQHKITITSDIEDAESLHAVCDSVRLKQVILNLLSNGIKYNRPAGWVNVKVFVLDDETLSISVEDNGMGIPDPKQRELFQPFNRLGAENSSVEGSGVGLVITKNLIEMMGGEICVYSQEGVGSCFEIHLPRADAEQSADAEPKDVVDIDSSVVLKLDAPKTVLYLEDNPDDIRLIDSVMKSVDQLTLHVAEDALLGVYKARTLCPDLILIDLNIAGLDLENTLTILKDEPSLRTTPIFGLGTQLETLNTNSADPNAHQLDMFFQKPINLEQFLSGLQHYLGSAEVADCHTSESHS